MEPSTSADQHTTLCQLCNIRPRVYTCPRCGIKYCNIDCYKSEAHLDCSEGFYKQCVEEELKTYENDPLSRQRMVDILKRVQEQEFDDYDLEDNIGDDEAELDSDDEEDYPDLEERLRKVNLDNADEVWSVLTNAEKQEFEALVKSGEAEKLLPQWAPWWTFTVQEKLIQDLDEPEISHDYMTKCPTPIEVPRFSEIEKASPNVCFNLINVVHAYAYVALFFNGDYLNSAKEAASVFLNICDNMRENKVFDEPLSAEQSVIERVINCNLIPENKEILSMTKDAANQIIQGPEERHKSFYMTCALSELHRLLTTAKQEISGAKSTGKSGSFSEKFKNQTHLDNTVLKKKTLLLCLKKLEYYLSYVKTYGVQNLCT